MLQEEDQQALIAYSRGQGLPPVPQDQQQEQDQGSNPFIGRQQ
jgi:hypothetical protein